MIGIGATLASLGVTFVKDLLMDNGETLVKEGIKKVTGIDLNKKPVKELSPQEIQMIKDSEFKLKELNFKELQAQIKAREIEEQEKTKRWESDNKSGSTFAKLVRPVLVVYLMIVVTLLALLDGNLEGFAIKESWVVLFTSLAVTALGGYFTLRTYEKRTKSNKWD